MYKPTLDLDVLRSFVCGIELGSFAKASERVGRSTSAVSTQLKKLEDQAGASLLVKSGRGKVLTPAGEVLFSYAKRLLELNDEAIAAIGASEIQGCVRIGLQEDFGEYWLAEVLGRFARAHPLVQIEVTVARNASLLEGIRAGHLDLALAWNAGVTLPYNQLVAEIPMCWIGRSDLPATDPCALVAFEAPCIMRSTALRALDEAHVPWRVTFTSSSLSGIWAAVGAGLGITVRTQIGLPKHLRVLNGLPQLPKIGLMLHKANPDAPLPIKQLEAIVLAHLNESLVSVP